MSVETNASWALSLYSHIQLLQSRTFDDVVQSTNTTNRKTVESEIPEISKSLSESALDDKNAVLEHFTRPSKRRERGPALHVLFLSSDTGGGHGASAESVGKQFQILYPGSTIELLDVVEKDGVPPYNSLVSAYKHLSGHPSQWKLVYNVSNSRAFEVLADAHLKLMCKKAVRRRIESLDPDVVVSVHPLMTNVPVLSCSKISKKTGQHLPIFTVVTDLGSAHCLWFANGEEKMFVGSEAVKELAKVRGKVPEEKLVLAGLPIRHDFALHAASLGDRYSPEGRSYQLKKRRELQLPKFTKDDNLVNTSEIVDLQIPTLLVMGGGEGVGSLENITDALYVELTSRGLDTLILVVCGRNEKLRTWIAERQWSDVFNRWSAAKQKVETRGKGRMSTISQLDPCDNSHSLPIIGLDSTCIEPSDVATKLRNMIMYTAGNMGTGSTDRTKACNGQNSSTGLSGLHEIDSGEEKKLDDADAANYPQSTTLESSPTNCKESCAEHGPIKQIGKVTVVGLGFIDKMAEYMVAADVLISKAGPGTIAEAASLSLPVMLTSFLLGQEEGNIDFVVDAKFGEYCPVSNPVGIATTVREWLQNEEKMKTMSRNAKLKGAPHAARDIAKAIGDSTLRWIEHNKQQQDSVLTANSFDTSNSAGTGCG